MSEKDLLLIMAQPRDIIAGWGLKKEDPHWFSKALDYDLDQLTVVHAIEEELPKNIEADGVILGGSAHSVYEEKNWIEDLRNLVWDLYEQEIPTLGVCFGHQIIIETLGGEVESGKHGFEMGLAEINLNKKGQQDKIFEGLGESFDVASSHQDTVTLLPEGLDKEVVELGHSEMYNHQATAIGDHMRTLQFHPEINPYVIEKVITSRTEKLVDEGVFSDKEEVDNHIEEIYDSNITSNGKKVLKNFYNHFV